MTNMISCKDAITNRPFYLNADKIVSFFQMSDDECDACNVQRPAVCMYIDHPKGRAQIIVVGTAHDLDMYIRSTNMICL